MKIEEVVKAVNRFYGDTSRSKAETLEGLEILEGEVEMMLDSLRSDIESEGE